MESERGQGEEFKKKKYLVWSRVFTRANDRVMMMMMMVFYCPSKGIPLPVSHIPTPSCSELNTSMAASAAAKLCPDATHQCEEGVLQRPFLLKELSWYLIYVACFPLSKSLSSVGQLQVG